MFNMMRLWDPLYGRIEMEDFEFNLISLPEIQRLRYVRMCNINSLLITGASEISRFEHTLGVIHLAKLWLQAHSVPISQGRDLIAAAALHDMQTGPFGHSMQYVLEDNSPESEFIHDDIAHGWRSAYHQNTLANSSFSGKPFGARFLLGAKTDAVASLIRGEGHYGPLISGSIDLDNIDNVVRLAFHAGLTTDKDKTLPINLVRGITISDGNLSIKESCIPYITRWQDIRTRLYRFLLHDWAEFSAKGMLTKAIEIAVNCGIVGSDSWLMTDDRFLDFLEDHGLGENQEVRELIRRLRRGDLYYPVALYESPSINLYSHLSDVSIKNAMEAELSRALKGRGTKPLIHFILDKNKTERSVSILLSDHNKVVTIGNNSERLLSGIFISNPKISESEKMMIADLFKQILTRHGVNSIHGIDDPMGRPQSDTQLKLL